MMVYELPFVVLLSRFFSDKLNYDFFFYSTGQLRGAKKNKNKKHTHTHTEKLKKRQKTKRVI